MDDLLSVPAAARELGVSRWAIWHQVRTQRLPAERVGRTWAVRRGELDTFKASYRPRAR